ncbi:MAG: ABC transporter substrate-binding protein [Hyphomicrobiales bacterium]|nr:ABC transporter substrate-binding protein [Hyphomicrobiales bacterium]
MTRRELLARSSALGLALAVSVGPIGRALASEPKKGGHMRIAMSHGSTSDTLDPATIENGLQWCAAYAVANTLTELTPDGTLAPALATEWEATPDAKTWTFKLRKGVEFHNGKTMTADDVIASINYHRGEESKSVGKPILSAITEIKADGPDTIVITLSGGNAGFPYSFDSATFCIYPAKDGGIDWQAGGTGGYRMKAEEPGVRYEFERNPNYWRDDRAHAATVELLSIKDPAARNNALITDSVDVIDQVDLKTVTRMQRVPNIVVEEGAGPLHYVFPMLSKTPPFDNLDLRKALKHAIDREEMVQKILSGHGVIGNDHPIGPSYRYYAADIEQTPYDPDKAKHFMKKSGLGDITLDLSAADAAFAGAVDAAQLFQASAEKAGIKVNVVREPNDGYWSNVWMQLPFCGTYWGGRPTQDLMFSTAYAAGAPWNETYWSHDRFNELLLAARAELNEDLRREMYFEMQQLCSDEGGIIIPMFAAYVGAHSDALVHGDQIASNWRNDGHRIAERWWFA